MVDFNCFFSQFPQYSNEHFAQPIPDVPDEPITLLNGIDAMWLFNRSIKILYYSQRLIDTTLGYMVAYQQPQIKASVRSIKQPIFHTIKQDIKRLWFFDSIGIFMKNVSDLCIPYLSTLKKLLIWSTGGLYGGFQVNSDTPLNSST